MQLVLIRREARTSSSRANNEMNEKYYQVFQGVRTRKLVKELVDVLDQGRLKRTIKKSFTFSWPPSVPRM